MNTFKVGDRVELIEDYAFFKTGTTGVVVGVDSSYAALPPIVKVDTDDTQNLECYASRLKLSEVPKFKRGDKVKCVDATGWKDITLGNTYVVLSADKGGVAVIDDVGEVNTPRPRRFELVEEPRNRFCINGGKWCDSLEEAKAWVQERGFPEGRYEIFEMIPRAIVTVKETVTRELIEA